MTGMRSHSHDTERTVDKPHELEHIVDVGESPKTPLILIGEVSVAASVVIAAILALSLLAHRLAS
jgi:hypothetical protein